MYTPFTFDEVPDPWTDLITLTSEKMIAFEMWGRRYEFSGSPLPTSIKTAGEEVLSSPIRVTAIANGNVLGWERKGCFLFQGNKVRAIVSGWQANEQIIVNTTSQIDFDGFMRIDMVIMPRSGGSAKLDSLWLEVPMRSDYATLFHYFPGRWGSAENSGAIPRDGIKIPFKPFLWLGWEDGGLSWFTESDKGWQVSNSNQCIEVIPQGNENLARFHLLDSQPKAFPVTYTFGFQATPVKPIPKDFHEWRICHGANYGIERREVGEDKSILDKMADKGVKTLVFHEHWTPIQNYWETTYKTELRQLVTECHKRGIKLLLYFGYELSTLSPEWGRVSDDVLVKGPQGSAAGGYYRYPDQRDYIVCYNSMWQDHLVNGVARAIERYGFDGVYLDGTIEPWGCANERHGCGYRDAEGNLRVTYPIFAVRNLMQRLYSIIHPKGGLINAHQSTCCVTPTLTYCHSYWDGEQFGGGELSGDPLQKLPLASFRAEFMGKNFGVPCEFLVYEKQPDWTFNHALAFTLLHDVRVRPGGYGRELDIMSEIWKAMTEFGIKDAQWYPYWKNQQLVNASPEEVKVSFYQRDHNLLLIVSNLSTTKPVEADVQLKLPDFENATAYDAISKEGLHFEHNRLKVAIEPMRARIVRIDRQE